MKAMKTITGVLLKVLDVLSIVLMVGMVVFLLIQLVARAVFTHGFSWTEESAKICLIMLAYVGASMTSVNGVHVNITILNDALHSARGRKVLFVLQQLLAMVFLVLVFVFSFPALEIASKSVTTISCVIMFFGHLAKIVRQFASAEYVAIVDEDRQEGKPERKEEDGDK